MNGKGIGWSSHPTCHPSRPTSTPVVPGVRMSISTTTAQGQSFSGPPVNVGLHQGDKRLADAKQHPIIGGRIQHRFSR